VTAAFGVAGAINITGYSSVIDRVRINGMVELGGDCRVIDSTIDGGNYYALHMGNQCVLLRSILSGGPNGNALRAGSHSLVEGNSIDGSDGGIYAGVGSRIVGNSIYTGDFGIYTSSAIVKGNVIRSGGGWSAVGIFCEDCIIESNFVSNFLSFGLEAWSSNTAYKGNTFENNNGGNANPQVSGGIETGTNVCGGNTTCP
jgi:hypothetical protein